MNPDRQLSITWLKAAVLGCLWASSEIVLGSFMHNLQVPFGSIFLTAIGVILLISVSYQWKEKGLIWRSGLICALMKSVSPSAVIFGPMIAILSEAFLLEFSVRILGKNVLGFLLGSLLAMSWSFFQKIANYIIFYGFNIVDLYASMVKFAEKQLVFHFNSVWMPIAALWMVYLLFGVISAAIGIHVGRTAILNGPVMRSADKKQMANIRSQRQSVPIEYSLTWLTFNFLGMVAVLVLMNFAPVYAWVLSGLVLIAVWIFRYKTALNPLKKPKFWAIFAAITMLSGFLFAWLQPSQISIAKGLMTGFQMNFRAAIMIVGFSVIGKELGSPVIRNFFIRTSYRQLPLALEIAFETLPFVIVNLPPLKDIFRKPVSVVRQIVSQAEFWLEKVALTMKRKSNVVIITGEIGSGKTALITELASLLKNRGIKIGGILAPAIYSAGEKAGYYIVDLTSGMQVQLSQIVASQGMPQVGKYFFIPEALAFGEKALSVDVTSKAEIVLIDEIGAWELQGQGWATSLNELIIQCKMPLIITVRNSFLELVTESWMFTNPLILKAGEVPVDVAWNKVIEFADIKR
jgi:nucleoside-triphosphatase THEP1